MEIGRINFAGIDIDFLNDSTLTAEAITDASTKLIDIYAKAGLSGIAFRCTALQSSDLLNDLLELLYLQSVPVLLVANQDWGIWSSANISLAAGVIVENACILPSGERRDYFRSRQLRELMARCSKEREDRPEFLIGFLELWEQRPHPSVVRRGVKLAEHFGAIIEHGPACTAGEGLPSAVKDASQTLSGFEYLRRAPVIELQKYWTSESRKVWVGPAPDAADDMSPLPLRSLGTLIPRLSELLLHQSLTPDLEDIRTEHETFLETPDYLREAPPRQDFWDYSSQGHKLSSRGCFPITTEPTVSHFDAVVQTQKHLKELHMLQPLTGAEVHRLAVSYRRLVDATNGHDLILALIEGLQSQQVVIYKGLDTGFGVPEGVSHFWGVSRTRDEADGPLVDIFISLKSPNDATTILHTWLAHHQVPRAERFDLEHLFERVDKLGGGESDLPISLKTAIERSSHAETLSLLQQIRVSGTPHRFGDAIISLCRRTLLEDTSQYSWHQTVAHRVLDRSMEIRELLGLRLAYFVRQGAMALPTVNNLVALYDSVSVIVEDALFFGDRESLNTMTDALLESWDPDADSKYYVDVNADLFAFVFLNVLRRVAFEEVYIEATDRCPFFLSQPDQAAVFSELWVLGSQCEIYFGILPRGLGQIVYNRYKAFLEKNPPGPGARKGNEIMSMYANIETEPSPAGSSEDQDDKSPERTATSHEKLEMWKKRFTELSAMSIFCLPAIVDILLLSFLGRGVFMTAFMDTEHLQAAGLALLISLLLTAGVTGWVGSIGNYYLVNYAYDNMIHFHIQRLSGGFILTLIVAVCGLIGFSVEYSVPVGLVFVAYMILMATYFNLLGVMATMHQLKSPITSGRTVLWRTIPLLLVSPLLSSLVNGHDLEIYLLVAYAFLFLALYHYRRLCLEWSEWMHKIPKMSEKDVVEWYKEKMAPETDDDEDGKQHQSKDAQEALRRAVSSYQRGDRTGAAKSTFVATVAEGMPYVEWLFKKTCPSGKPLEVFSTSWFTQLGESCKQQKQLSRGLKEHNIFMLFRFAKYDMGQNLGLFLVALMDRWVSIVMGARLPRPSMYVDSRSRYGICFCILYFCASVMLLDATLQKYWEVSFKLSEEKLINHEHALEVTRQWERRRIRTLVRALLELLAKISGIFGLCTILMWLLVENPATIILYYCYALGYTCVILFQFNRCFTTNVRAHITIILSSSAVGFVVGCTLRAIPATAGWLYSEILAQNLAAVLAATGTFLWTFKDWSSPSLSSTRQKTPYSSQDHTQQIHVQPRLSTESNSSEANITQAQVRNIRGTSVTDQDGSFVAREVQKLLRVSLDSPNLFSKNAPWSEGLLRTATTMWTDRRVVVTVVSRHHFVKTGLENISSFSQFKSGILEVVVGVLGDNELQRSSWQHLLSNLVAESILYHVSCAEFGMSHARAVRAEHFLHETQAISKRLDFELAFEEETSLSLIARRTNLELMKHICLDFPVDSQWDLMPEPARRAIVSRVSGDRVDATRDLLQWVDSNGIDIETVDFHVGLCLRIYQKVLERGQGAVSFPTGAPQRLPTAALRSVRIARARRPQTLLQDWLRWPVKVAVTFAKWVAIISGAGSDIERELWYCLKDVYLNKLIISFLLFIWRCCWHAKNLWLYGILIYHRPSLLSITRLAQKGARRKVKGNRIVVELPRKTVTGFSSCDNSESMVLAVFDGAHTEAPADKPALFKAIYDEELRLQARVDNGTLATTYNYSDRRSKWPVSKEVNDKDFRTIGFYDKFGRIHRGTMTIGDKEFAFQYHYKATPRGNADVLSADFKQVDPISEDMISIFWGVPLNDEDFAGYDWVPSEKLCRLVKVVGDKTYVTQVEYKHRRDPLITAFLEEEDGRKTAIARAPTVFAEEPLFLTRPNNLSFDSDNLLVYHSKAQVQRMRRHALGKSSFFAFMNPMNYVASWGRQVYHPIPTWHLRTELWNEWLTSENMDAPTACWLDELILREEPRLREYWRARDRGDLHSAKRALDKHIDQIVSAIEIQTDVSEMCLLPIKPSDLYAMGLGKDATQVTTRPEDCFRDTEDRVSVIFNDIGCWPEAPGGVSNCRRDLVNGHSTIRNHVLAECANDYGIPRFQVEKNVQSLKLLPLWGLDRKTAHHGLIDNLLQSQVDDKVRDTDVQRDIVSVFIPLLKDFVKGARTRRYSRADLIKFSNVVLSMSTYYEHKDYSRTWESREVEEAWVDAWLIPYNDPNIVDPSTCFELERPSMSDFREALGIYLAYFFIFSVKIPDHCPRVFQSTHHGISSLFGMILRYRRGVTFGIWDHAILWRECCLNISPAQCELPISVQSMLLSGIGLATRLAYFHADTAAPPNDCLHYDTSMWEAEIGTDRGQMGSKRVFNRRIDPIVNGISNMESFTPVDKVRTDKPTVVMLSNVQFIKGIKTAILAADIIVNRYGFQDYQLVVYGAKDRQPSYALEMAKLIVENNLSDKVILAGFGKPKEILKDAWLFMNSSISEGLPLAIGEAALAGVPIVATEVGATALVMTDPQDQDKRYGEVVPPNDPLALARAQLNILSMVGPWAKFTKEAETDPAAASAATLPDEIMPSDVQWLTQRMYDKSADRRRLGLLSREVVLHSFHGNRYLREHEQMYWIQWHLAQMRRDEALSSVAAETYRFGVPQPLRYAEEEEDDFENTRKGYEDIEEVGTDGSIRGATPGVSPRWQDFTDGTGNEKKPLKRLSKQRRHAVVSPV
ncbi:hypothetical protein ACO1O0_002376 [Amphichorda felina]